MDSNDSHSANELQAGLKCIPQSAIVILLIILIITSIIFNGFILNCSWKEFHRNTYAVCLVSMSLNNLLASCVSLPLYYMDRQTNNVMKHIPLQLANTLCLAHHVSIFTCLAVGLCTLDIICWDRYEALTRLGKARRITPVIALRIIAAVTVFVFSFLMITSVSRFKYMVEGHYTCTSNEIMKKDKASPISVMVLVSVMIVSSKAIAIFTLSSIAKQIRRHIAEVRQTLGSQNAVKELNLVKVSVVIFVAFTVTWLPFGVSRALMNVNRNYVITCFYSVSNFWAYSLFSILPLLCVCTDKKMKSSLRQRFFSNRVAAAVQISSSASTRVTSM